MSKHETPMILEFWNSTGGTLILEFQAVARSPGVGRRLIDAVILPAEERRQAHWNQVDIEGRDVIAVQAKAKRLAMTLMGQAVFSAELLRRRFRPRSIRSVILCGADDAVLRPLLKPYPEVEVVIIPYVPITPSEEETG
jgi:hypothetical protein